MPEALAILNTCYMSKVIVHKGSMATHKSWENHCRELLQKGAKLQTAEMIIDIDHCMLTLLMGIDNTLPGHSWL